MLPPGRPPLLVGAMHAGEIDTVLDQSVKATADVGLWHLRTFAALQRQDRYWTNNGQSVALARNGLAANDPQRPNLKSRVASFALC